MKKLLILSILLLALNGCAYGYNTLKEGIHEDIKNLEQELQAQIDELSEEFNNKICKID